MELEQDWTGGLVTPLSQTVRLDCGAKNACTYIPTNFDYENEDGFDDVNGDIYIMMHVCLFVCHEKSSLPLQVCDFLSENVWVKKKFL